MKLTLAGGMALPLYLPVTVIATCSAFCPTVLACLGFLSPANRGALMTCAVVLWVLLGTPAGYVSSRMYKSECGYDPLRTALLKFIMRPLGLFVGMFYIVIF